MTEQNNFTKDTKQLIIEFVDNCKESFQRLEKLIRLNEDGLMKCFEWSEKSETKLNGLVNLFDVINKKQDGNSIRIEKFENEVNSLRGQIEGLADHIEKVHDLVNLEDRITACDVLNRLTLLEGKIHPDSTLPFALSLNDRMELIENFYNEQKEIVDKLNDQDKSGFMWQKGQIEALYERIKSLEFHKNLQIDENRKISKRMDDIENGYIKRIGILGKALNNLSEENDRLMKMQSVIAKI